MNAILIFVLFGAAYCVGYCLGRQELVNELRIALLAHLMDALTEKQQENAFAKATETIIPTKQ